MSNSQADHGGNCKTARALFILVEMQAAKYLDDQKMSGPTG